MYQGSNLSRTGQMAVTNDQVTNQLKLLKAKMSNRDTWQQGTNNQLDGYPHTQPIKTSQSPLYPKSDYDFYNNKQQQMATSSQPKMSDPRALNFQQLQQYKQQMPAPQPVQKNDPYLGMNAINRLNYYDQLKQNDDPYKKSNGPSGYYEQQQNRRIQQQQLQQPLPKYSQFDDLLSKKQQSYGYQTNNYDFSQQPNKYDYNQGLANYNNNNLYGNINSNNLNNLNNLNNNQPFQYNNNNNNLQWGNSNTNNVYNNNGNRNTMPYNQYNGNQYEKNNFSNQQNNFSNQQNNFAANNNINVIANSQSPIKQQQINSQAQQGSQYKYSQHNSQPFLENRDRQQPNEKYSLDPIGVQQSQQYQQPTRPLPKPQPIYNQPSKNQAFNPIDELPAVAKKNPANALPPEEDDDADLVECPEGCGRRFKENALDKHVKVCKKIFQSKRKEFNSKAHRQVNQEQVKLEKQGLVKDKIIEKKKQMNQNGEPKWKKQSEAFRQMVGAAKQGDAVQMPVDDDMVECPSCGRKFNESAAERHIPGCKKRSLKR